MSLAPALACGSVSPNTDDGQGRSSSCSPGLRRVHSASCDKGLRNRANHSRQMCRARAADACGGWKVFLLPLASFHPRGLWGRSQLPLTSGSSFTLRQSSLLGLLPQLCLPRRVWHPGGEAQAPEPGTDKTWADWGWNSLPRGPPKSESVSQGGGAGSLFLSHDGPREPESRREGSRPAPKHNTRQALVRGD